MFRLALGCLAAALCAGQGAAAEPPSLALVIGNSTYPGLPPLPACAASVSVVSAALKRAGFQVTERQDVSNGRMGSAITDFGEAAARVPGGVAVAYVCGYAVAFDGRVFLLPASANLERETDALTQGVVGRLLVSSVVNAEGRAGLVLLDSVGRPGSTAPLPLDALVNPATLGGTGFVAVHSTRALPAGPTPLAAAVVAGMAAPAVEVRALLKDIASSVQGAPGATLVSREPAAPAFLVGAATAPAPAAPPVAAAPTSAASKLPAAPAALNEADRRRVQLALQRLGYYGGKVDGTYGADSLAAIRRFQHEIGAEMTGRLTTEQAARLMADGR